MGKIGCTLLNEATLAPNTQFLASASLLTFVDDYYCFCLLCVCAWVWEWVGGWVGGGSPFIGLGVNVSQHWGQDSLRDLWRTTTL